MRLEISYPCRTEYERSDGTRVVRYPPKSATVEIEERDARSSVRLGSIPTIMGLAIEYHGLDGRLFIEAGRFMKTPRSELALTDQRRRDLAPFRGLHRHGDVEHLDLALLGTPFLIKENYWYWTPSDPNWRGADASSRRPNNVARLIGESQERSENELRDWLSRNARLVDGTLMVAAPDPLANWNINGWINGYADPFALTRGDNSHSFFRIDVARDVLPWVKLDPHHKPFHRSLPAILEAIDMEAFRSFMSTDPGEILARRLCFEVLHDLSKTMAVTSESTIESWHRLKLMLEAPRIDAGDDLLRLQKAQQVLQSVAADLGKVTPVATTTSRIALGVRAYRELFQPLAELKLRERDQRDAEQNAIEDDDALALAN